MTYAIILDTETTGINTPHATEIAWIGIDDTLSTTGVRFCQRLNPNKPIEPKASKVSKIYNHDVDDCPSHTSFRLPPITYLIGHNIHYDCTVLKNAGVDLLGIRTICTKQLAQILLPNLKKHSLGYLLVHFYPDENDNYAKHAHSALHDVEFTYQVFLKLACQANTSNLKDLWQLNLPTKMPFGKYKGQPFNTIPTNYKNWLANQDIDTNLRSALLN